MNFSRREEALLEVADMSVTFGRVRPREVVSGISFSVGRAETVALVGESGSGKSVTALAVMGLLPEHTARVSNGRIAFDGRELLSLTAEERRRLRGVGIGMIFQEPMTSLNPVLSIGRQMTEAMVVHREVSIETARRQAIEMLDRVGISAPAGRLRQFPHEFSGGMRQRVMIAMAMMLKPRLVIADEPTTALDVTIQAQILDLMRALTRDSGTSLLLITHDMGVVAEMADRVVVLRRGRVVESAPVVPLFANPQAAYTRALLAAVPRLDVAGSQRRVAEPKAQPILRLSLISKSFDGLGWSARRRRTLALDGVSLDLFPGETVALVGESGSGKSTLGRIATRLIEPDAGTVFVAGKNLSAMSRARLRNARSLVQIIFQDPFASLDPRFSVGRSVAEPMAIHGRHPAAEIRRRVEALLDRVGLPAAAAPRLPHEFSGGQRQRIAIARALAVEPKVIVADEPTSALDVSIQAQILDLLGDLQAQERIAFLFITHDLSVVRQIAHRVAVMRAGRIVEVGAADAILDRPAHPYTLALLSAAPVPDPARRGRARIAPPTEPGNAPLVAISSDHWAAI